MCGHNREGSTPRPSKPGRRKDMELSPSLDLGTIYIASFRGMTDHSIILPKYGFGVYVWLEKVLGS